MTNLFFIMCMVVVCIITFIVTTLVVCCIAYLCYRCSPKQKKQVNGRVAARTNGVSTRSPDALLEGLDCGSIGASVMNGIRERTGTEV